MTVEYMKNVNDNIISISCQILFFKITRKWTGLDFLSGQKTKFAIDGPNTQFAHMQPHTNTECWWALFPFIDMQ